jgi:hypothetical protein
LATTKDPNNVPLDIRQLDVFIAPPDNEQVVSAVEKPEPETVTVAPTVAEVALSVIDG